MLNFATKNRNDNKSQKRTVFGHASRNATIILIILAVDFAATLTLSLFTNISAYAITFVNVVFLGLVAYLLLKSLVHNPIVNRYDRLNEALIDAEQKSKSFLRISANLIIALNDKGRRKSGAFFAS